MRLDARDGDTGWQCFDVQRCALVPEAVWVDSDSATWGSLDMSRAAIAMGIFCGRMPTITHYEKCIVIVPTRRMVLFNPIDGEPEESVRDVIVQELHPKRQQEFT